MAANDSPLSWPASEVLLLKFVVHHLWRPQQREIEPNHGIPAGVEEKLRQQGFLRVSGPHAPSTVRRRLANWSTLTRWRGLGGAFSSPAVKSAIRLAVRAVNRLRSRKSGNAMTGDILTELLGTCSGGDVTDIRDRAILPYGGPCLRWPSSERNSKSSYRTTCQTDACHRERRLPLPSLTMQLGRTKTRGADHAEIVYLTGRPVHALSQWLEAAKIDKGNVFRKVDRWGNVSARAGT